MASGMTMQVALATLRREYPAHIIVAVPVASVSACKQLATQIDALVCLFTPEHLALAAGMAASQQSQMRKFVLC